MKLPRFSAFSRCVLGVAAVTTLTFQASAAPFFWKTSAAAADWETGTNWSTTNVATGPSPAAGPASFNPTTGDIVTFTVNSPSPAVTQTVNLKGTRSALGLITDGQTFTTNIVGGGTASTLNLGKNGIVHNVGGLTIGSATAGQGVNVQIMDSQLWESGSLSGNPVAITVHNNITNGAASFNELQIGGNNTGSIINGNMTDGATHELWVTKWGTGLWTLTGTGNTCTVGVQQGTLRLTNAGAAAPAKAFVVPGATLSLRSTNGTTGFTKEQLDLYRTTVAFDAGGQVPPAFAIDTNNGNFTYDSVLINGVSAANDNFDFKKLGGNTLTLTGNNSGFPKNTIVAEGTLALATPNTRPGLVTVEPVGTLAAVVGGVGFTVSEIDALIATTTFNEDTNTGNKGSFGLSTANGDVVYPSVLSGPIRFNKSGANTLAMTADNTYTGATLLSGGSLSVARIPNGGLASPLGTSGSGAGNLIFAGGRLTYTGPTAAPDRLFSMTSSGSIEASGTGSLTFGAGTITHSGASGRTLALSGINQDNNTIASTLINSGTGGNTTSVNKTGYGNWTLTGPSTATGFVRGRGGNITLDYSDADVWAGNVLIQAGTVELKAAAGGTTETMPSLQVGEAHNGLGNLKLTGAVNLTVTTLEGSSQSQRHNLIDLGTGGSITVGALNASNNLRVGATTGLILNSAATVDSTGRANIILKATDGTYGFAAFAPGATTGQLQKLIFPPANVLTPGAPVAITSNTTNYYLGAGSYTTTAATVNFSTLTLDSGAGPVEFAVADGQRIGPSLTGKSILTSGANNITISGGNTTNLLSQPTWFHNYLNPSATLNITANIGNSSFFIIGGTGYTNYSGTGLGNSGSTQFVQNGGVLRLTANQNLTTSTGVLRVTDGIFEIGADLNDATPGDFTRVSDGNFRLLGNAGFSAYTATPGGTRVANFSNAAPLVWGSADFLGNAAESANDGDFAFRFGSARSNATIEFTNAIDLNGRLRAVEVANGDSVNGAETDAVLSGVLSGSAVAGLVKTGLGTLSLTGLNTYGGETRVMEGVLKVKAGSIPSGSRLIIGPNGKLSVSGNVGVQSVVINGVEQGPGVVNAPDYITGGGALYVGTAPVGMTYELWVTNKALQPAESDELFDADFDGMRNILEYGLGTEPKVPNGSVLTHNAGNSVFRFNRATDRTDITTVIESSETLTGTWSTIATSNGTGAFVLGVGVTGVTIDETTPGTVIVTTSPTGAPAKKFHRVRVTK